MLKKMLKGNVVAIGKNYNELSGDEIKALMYLQTLSNSNNVVVATNLNVLSMFSGIDKRYLSNYIEKLVEKEKISIDGDIKKYCHITINIDNNFEKFNVEFILDMLKDLNGSELKLYCTMIKYLNLKNNKNYIYPSMATLVEGYYSANELKDVELDDKLKEKYLNKLKNKLIEKGYIKMIAAYYFETKSGDKGKSSLGYFLKTDKNEVNENEYFDFVKGEINKYNENHSNIMKLATEEYLKKCKYKNLDKYIYYRHQEESAVKEENQKQVQAVEEVEPVVETEEVIEETKQNETIQEEVVNKTLDTGASIEETFKNIFELDYIKNEKLKWLKDSIEELISKANECGLNKNDYCKMLNDWIFSYKKLVEDLGVSAALNKMHRDIEVDCLNYKSQKHFDYKSISHEIIYEDYIVPEQKVNKKRKKGIFELLDSVDRKAVEPETDEFVAEINSWFNN